VVLAAQDEGKWFPPCLPFKVFRLSKVWLGIFEIEN